MSQILSLALTLLLGASSLPAVSPSPDASVGPLSEHRDFAAAGAPRRAGRQIELPLTLELPAEAFTLSPAGQGYWAETTLSLSVLDARGAIAPLAPLSLRLFLPEPPAPGSSARHETTLKLPRSDDVQRVVVGVQDGASGALLWDEVEVGL